jgi:predicted ATPase
MEHVSNIVIIFILAEFIPLIMIKKVKAINFKSFESIEIDLSDLNIVLGPNASGKSNLASIFQFIRDIATLGLSNAISLQGGLEYLLNFKNSKKQQLELEIQFDKSQVVSFDRSNQVKFSDIYYNIKIYPFLKKKGMKKYIEEVSLKFTNPRDISADTANLRIISDNGRIRFEPEDVESEFLKTIHPFLMSLNINIKGEARSLISSLTLFFILGIGIPNFIQVYDFDPKLSKKAIPISGKAELEPDGSNTALVLRKMLENPEEKRRFIQYLKVCLPFVKDLSFENQVDKSIILKVAESYNPGLEIPSSIISDGTVEIVSLIYALFFDDKRLIVIEEPERNIHPHLIASLMHLVQEASNEKQIIITTHSPELIKYSRIEDLLIIERDRDGASKVSRVSDKSSVKAFLKDNIGIEELFVDGILN